MALTAVDLSDASKRAVPELTNDIPFGITTRPVGDRARVASVEVFKTLLGGFMPVSLGSATVSGQVSTWRATNIAVPAAGLWFLLRVDLLIHRGLYFLSGDQWRTLTVAASGDAPTDAETIPLAGGYFYDTRVLLRAGRAGGDSLLVGYDDGKSGGGSYDVELFQL